VKENQVEREKDTVYKLAHEVRAGRESKEKGRGTKTVRLLSTSTHIIHGKRNMGKKRDYARSRVVRTIYVCWRERERDEDRKKTIGYRVNGRWSV